MTNIRGTLGSALIAATAATVAVALPADAGVTKHAGARGKIHVKLVRDDGQKSPKGFKICAYRTAKNADEFPVGHCDVTNKHGIAVLTHVKVGRWPIGIPLSPFRYRPAPKKIKVRAGHTTSYHWSYVDVSSS
jgi:hypothetical protein